MRWRAVRLEPAREVEVERRHAADAAEQVRRADRLIAIALGLPDLSWRRVLCSNDAVLPHCTGKLGSPAICWSLTHFIVAAVPGCHDAEKRAGPWAE